MTVTDTRRIASAATFLLAVLAFLHHGEAIICYQCNSAFDPRCGDPFDPYSLGTVNCSFQPKMEHLGNLEPTLCRKILQKVYGKIRVVRGCGYVTEEKVNGECAMRSGTHDVMAHYCACTGDLCNSSNENSASIALIAILPFLAPFLTP